MNTKDAIVDGGYAVRGCNVAKGVEEIVAQMFHGFNVCLTEIKIFNFQVREQ